MSKSFNFTSYGGEFNYSGTYDVVINKAAKTFTITLDVTKSNISNFTAYTQTSFSYLYDSNKNYYPTFSESKIYETPIPDGRINKHTSIYLGSFTKTFNMPNNIQDFYVNMDGDGLINIGKIGLSNTKIKINNVWKIASVFKKINGVWKRCIVWKKINGIWKR